MQGERVETVSIRPAKPAHESETPAFWATRSHEDLATRVASLHRQRRELQEGLPRRFIEHGRAVVAKMFIRGVGIEVGAGPRPWPIPPGATCGYGDIRDSAELQKYFGKQDVQAGSAIDAQSFEGVADASMDFIISAHVIEHLFDPIGSIVNAVRRLKPGGCLLLAVPNMVNTWDKGRTPTPLSHLIADSHDGGDATKLEAYTEFLRDVARPQWGNATSDEAMEREARRMMERKQDIHVHCWTYDSFAMMLDHTATVAPMHCVGGTESGNECIFVMRRNAGL